MEHIHPEISIIGASILDVLAYPVSEQLFTEGSVPMEGIKVSYGGDALNESVVLARLGAHPRLISNLGDDEAGRMVLRYCRDNGIDTCCISIIPGLSTGINIVLTDTNGERHFLTNPHGSLRTLSLEDISPYIDNLSGIVSFASLFVSECLSIHDMSEAFRRIREGGCRALCADMTRTKHGESLEDMKSVLRYVDYIFPNESEISRLTGIRDTERNAKLLLKAGVGCAVIKTGAKGCYIRTKDTSFRIPAYEHAVCVDTTGAGDTFAAGFIWALSEGCSLPDCGRFACAAASCAIEALGASDSVRSLEQVMERYSQMPDIIWM